MGILFLNAKLFNGLLDLKLKEPYRQILESANSGNWRQLGNMFGTLELSYGFSLEQIEILFKAINMPI